MVDSARLHRGRCYLAATAGRRHHGVDQAVGDGLGGGHEAVAVDVLHHLLDVAAGVAADDLGHLAGHGGDLAGGDLDVGGRAAEPAEPWWIISFAFGSAKRLPGAPPAMIMAAADMPIPKQIVDTSGRTCCIAS